MAQVQRSPLNRLLCTLAVLFCFFSGFLVFGLPNFQDPQAAKAAEVARLLDEARTQLNEVVKSLPEKQRYIEQLEKQRGQASSDAEKASLTLEIENASLGIRDLEVGFVDIASGGVKLKTASSESEKFDWQSETLEIVKPLFDELKGFTEKPRMIERLRREIEQLEAKMLSIRGGIDRMEQLKQGMEKSETLTRLTALRDRWLEIEADTLRELEFTRLRLDEISGPQQTFWGRVKGVVGSFLAGRGVNILLAIVVFCSVFALMRWAWAIFFRLRKRHKGSSRSVFDRLFIFGYRILTVLVATGSLLMTIYVFEDWLSLGLVLLILAGIVIALKNSIPRFFLETKLLLNVGPVREGERVVYNGLPWLVPSINVFTHIVNPELEGGVLRLTLADLLPLRSRPRHADEPWFPSKKGDWMLIDDYLGQVIRQTPESVQLAGFGHAQRTYKCEDYLGTEALNLSTGTFGVVETFGIDYEHQVDCTEAAPQIMQDGIRERLDQWDKGTHVESINVQFKEAASSSLDLLIMLTVNSEAAKDYYLLKRLIQRACVEICTQESWGIPFHQLTVHGIGEVQPDAET